MADIRLEALRKEFGDLVAVRDITITFPSSSVTCLLGPSGCGKTTLMRMIAGLEVQTSGEVYFGDERVSDLTPSERNIGMVFQYPVVYRGMTVYRNIELPLSRDRSVSAKERKERIETVLESLDLQHAAQMDVNTLDNGTRQKVAVAREVARRPRIILFDEPITNVDVNSKLQLKQALKRLVKQHNQTIVYVTHDQTEAMTLADEIALMREGEILQRGTPRELYDNPNARFGGWFLGNPGMNFVECEVVNHDGDKLIIDPIFPKPLKATSLPDVKQVVIGIRPERMQAYDAQTPNTVEAQIIRSAMTVGGQHLTTVQAGDEVIRVKTPHEQRFEVDSTIYVEAPLQHVAVFGEDGSRLDVELSYADSVELEKFK